MKTTIQSDFALTELRPSLTLFFLESFFLQHIPQLNHVHPTIFSPFLDLFPCFITCFTTCSLHVPPFSSVFDSFCSLSHVRVVQVNSYSCSLSFIYSFIIFIVIPFFLDLSVFLPSDRQPDRFPWPVRSAQGLRPVGRVPQLLRRGLRHLCARPWLQWG